MRIVVAPDSYKGSLSALQVAQAMERGIRAVYPGAEVDLVPIADGGEGTVESLARATGGRLEHATVSDPLGRPVRAAWGILGDGRTAVLEMAAASGLPLLAPEERDPRVASTCGTGQLVRAVLDRGLRRLIVGIGGSATNDGGAGLARALGARFLDAGGAELPEGGAALARLARVELSGMDARLAEAELVVACDVDNPLCGERGASAVYGPQKGATPEMVAALDAALANYARVAGAATGRDVAAVPGAGAAGGLGAGFLLFTGARFRPGIEVVLEACGFQERVRNADLVLTGEGRTDAQTAMGKAPVGVARLAGRAGVPVLCLSGSLGPGAEAVLEQGIAATLSVVPGPMTLETCMADAALLVEQGAARLCRILRAGAALGRAGA
jgi:glycerate kinase